MGNESSAEQQEKQKQLEQREKWMMEQATKIVQEYVDKKGWYISVLVAPQNNAHDDSGLECLERKTDSKHGVTCDIYIGGTGNYINKGSRGYCNWTCYGYDHRQNENVMILGEKNGAKYLKLQQEAADQEDEKGDEIIECKFDINSGDIVSKTPQCIFEGEEINRTSVLQEFTFASTSTVTHNSKFENTSGISVTAGVKFEAEAPGVKASASLETTASTSFTTGQDNTVQQTYTISKPVKIPPNTKVVCEGIVWKSKINVPYTIRFRRNGKEYEDKGVWKAVTSWKLRYETTEHSLE